MSNDWPDPPTNASWPDPPSAEWPDPPATQRPNALQRALPYAVRSGMRGVADSFLALPQIAGGLGWEGAGNFAERADNYLDRNLAPDAKWSENPAEAAGQLAAGVLMPMGPVARGLLWAGRQVVPNAVRTRVAASPAAQGATTFTGRAIEATVLPGTAPYRPSNIALNFGVGATAGVTLETLGSSAQATRQARQDEIQRAEAEQRLASIADRTWQEAVVDNVPAGLALLVAGGAGAAGGRAYLQARRANAANANTAASPGTPDNYTMPFDPGTAFLEAGVLNRHATIEASLRDAIKRGVTTIDDAHEAYSRIVLNTAESVNNDRAHTLMRTGYGPNGMFMVTPYVRHMERVQLLNESQRAKLRDLIPVSDELNMRAAALGARRMHGASTTEPARTGLHTETYADLRLRRAQAMQDPDVVARFKEHRGIYDDLLNHMVRTGTVSAREAADMKRMNPDYMHRMVQDMKTVRGGPQSNEPLKRGTESDSPFTKRTRDDSSGPEKFADPFMSMQDSIRQVIDFGLRNQAVRELSAMGGQGVLGIGRNMLDTPTARATAVKANPGMVLMPYRDKRGTRMLLEVDPMINAAIAAYPRAHAGVFSSARGLYQRFTTGAPAALLGYIQPLASAIMGAQSIATNLPRQLATGYVDSFLKRNGIDLRVADPTALLTIPIAVAKAGLDLSAGVVARSINRSIDANGVMAATLGPARAQRVAQSMMQHYSNSSVVEMQRSGLLSQGFAYGADAVEGTAFADKMRAFSAMVPRSAATTPYDGFAKGVTDLRSREQINEYIAMRSAQLGGQPGFRHARQMFIGLEKLADLVASAPMIHAFDVNRGRMPSDILSSTIRQAVGDPAQYGRLRSVQMLTSALPYSNIALQTGHAYTRAMRRDPVTTAIRTAQLGLFGGLTTIASAILWDRHAQENGQEPQALRNLVTMGGRDAAGAMYMHVPGEPLEAAVRVPYEQTFTPIFAMIRGGLITALGLDDPAMHGPEGDDMHEHIVRMIAESNDATFTAGVGLAGADVANNPLVNLGMALGTGQNSQDMLALATSPGRITPLRDAEGFETAMMTRDAVPRVFAIAAETVLGAGGQSALDLARTWGFAGRITDRTTEKLGAVAEQYTLNLGASARIFGPALGQQRRVPQNDAIGEYVNTVERRLREFQQNIAQVRSGDTPTRGGMRTLQDSPAGRATVPPETREVILTAHAMSTNRGVRQLIEQRTMLRDAVRETSATPQMRLNPGAMRTRVNELNTEIRTLNNQIYSVIADVEGDLSQQFGRSIRIAEIDPMRGLEQFAPMD